MGAVTNSEKALKIARTLVFICAQPQIVFLCCQLVSLLCFVSRAQPTCRDGHKFMKANAISTQVSRLKGG